MTETLKTGKAPAQQKRGSKYLHIFIEELLDYVFIYMFLSMRIKNE